MSNTATLPFQVRIRINKNSIKVLGVASSSEEFEKLTIGELKEKALSLFPGVDDLERLRVIFGQNELEDDQTFESCNIEHLSVLVVVLLMPGGKVFEDVLLDVGHAAALRATTFGSQIDVLFLSSNCPVH